MQVINLVHWAGRGFSYVPGDEISLPDATAEARVAAGLAEHVPAPTAADEPPRRRASRA